MPVYKFSHHLLAVLVHLAHTAVKWNTNFLTLDVGDKLVNPDDTALMKYEKKFMQKAVSIMYTVFSFKKEHVCRICGSCRQRSLWYLPNRSRNRHGRCLCASRMNEAAWKPLTAFCMNFFSYFIRAVSSVFTSLSPTSRVNKFVFHFTAVCAKWTRSARRWWLYLYTGMPYDKLSFG